MKLFQTSAVLIFGFTSFSAVAADYPTPKEGDWVARDFKFHTGDVMPELRIHYTTVGDPSGQPVLVLHGSGGSAASMLTPAFAGALYGPGQPLDAAKYYIIIPDAIGHGKSTKPSDGLKIKFPQYDYADMSTPSTDCSAKVSASLICASSSVIRWAAWRHGSGAKNIPDIWMHWYPWRHCRPRWRAATGCSGE